MANLQYRTDVTVYNQKELFSIVPHLASLLRLSDVFPCFLCVLVTLIKQTKIISWKPGDGSAKGVSSWDRIRFLSNIYNFVVIEKGRETNYTVCGLPC